MVGVALVACSGRQETGSSTSSAPTTAATRAAAPAPAGGPTVEEFEVPSRTGPHDVAPAVDGGVWYTAQGSGELGHLDPRTGNTRHIALGNGSAPHGVIVGPDGAPWVTDGGAGAIVRVDPASGAVQRFPVPGRGTTNLNTAAFDASGVLWFTDQAGSYGRLDPRSGRVETFDAPKGRGPYGITRTPDGAIWYSSLAGSYLARIDTSTGGAEVFDVPSPGGGARRVWSDSSGRLWVTEWFAGRLARFDPKARSWSEWRLPGARPQPYAVFVDDRDAVWVSDFDANALVRFDPAEQRFQSFPLPQPEAGVRQILGRPGEVWGAESGAARLVMIRT